MAASSGVVPASSSDVDRVSQGQLQDKIRAGYRPGALASKQREELLRWAKEAHCFPASVAAIRVCGSGFPVVPAFRCFAR